VAAVTGERDPKVARALATPTRAAILDLIRAEGPLTAKEVAGRAGLHPNVARGHLDVLVDAGLAVVKWRRLPGGGRPAKLYETAPAHVEQGTTLVADMLATLIEQTGPAAEPARRVAFETGERLGRRHRPASERPTFEEQVIALVRALSEVSGATRISARGDSWVELEDRDCPFRGIARAHPELACSLDKALKEGIMQALGADAYVEQVTSIAWGDDVCREVVRLRTPRNEGR
jgi:predicted ArsR family transcriptional regulator